LWFVIFWGGGFFFYVSYADLVTRVRPRPEFEKTGLYIQREIFNVNVTGRLVGGRRLPRHQAVVVHYGFRVQFQLVVTVSAAKV
jgi:hypothetical protein